VTGTDPSAVANTETDRSSVTDPLLGIFIFGYLRARLTREAARGRQTGQSISVVMADVDRFETINDTHGPEIGHLVLRHAVTVARSTLRQSDWMARYSREGFVVVLPDTTLLGAYSVAERMRRLCADTDLDLSGARLTFTASFGVATIDGVVPSEADGEDLLRLAEKALDEGRRAGSNRVTCGPKSTPAIPASQPESPASP
jgi:diguanylate cyclase (GGDEF)-like protein